jgi:hypothetical protein
MREQEPLIKVHVDLLIAQFGKKVGEGEATVDFVGWYPFQPRPNISLILPP